MIRGHYYMSSAYFALGYVSSALSALNIVPATIIDVSPEMQCRVEALKADILASINEVPERSGLNIINHRSLKTQKTSIAIFGSRTSGTTT